MLAFIFVALLGHDEWQVREAASRLCQLPECDGPLRQALRSENPEVRYRASAIIVPRDRKRENDYFQEHTIEWFYTWLKSGCPRSYVSDYTIIETVIRNEALRFYIQNESGHVDLGRWSRPGDIKPEDYFSLEQFRQKMRTVPEVMPCSRLKNFWLW